MAYSKALRGFTLVEVLVSLILVGGLILVLSTLVLPIGISKNTNVQTQAIALGRSYMELIKSRWQVNSDYIAESLPSAGTAATNEIKLPSGWVLETNQADWAATDTIRTVRVIVKPSSTSSEWVTLETRISQPSF